MTPIPFQKTEVSALPLPLYKVELVKDGRKRYYEATSKDGLLLGRFQGATGISGMLDDGKSNGFAKAAAKIAADSLKAKFNGPGGLAVADFALAETEYLRQWAGKRDRGTDYHDLLEKRISGLPYTTTVDFEEMWGKLQKTLHQQQIDLLTAEAPCASLLYGFGTKIDAVGRMMGDIGVIDWKTSKFISKEYFLQVGGASAQSFTETYGTPAKWAKIFRWDFASKYWEVKDCNLERDLRGFLAARHLKDVCAEIEKDNG